MATLFWPYYIISSCLSMNNLRPPFPLGPDRSPYFSFAWSFCHVDTCLLLWPWWLWCDWSDVLQRSVCTSPTRGPSWAHQPPRAPHSPTGVSAAQVGGHCLPLYFASTDPPVLSKISGGNKRESYRRRIEERGLWSLFLLFADSLDSCQLALFNDTAARYRKGEISV